MLNLEERETLVKVEGKNKEIGETKLFVKCDSGEGIEAVIRTVKEHRKLLQNYILQHPEFKAALGPQQPPFVMR